MRLWLMAALIDTVLSVAPVPLYAQDAVTAFENVTVIPMDSERVLTSQTVVVRGDRIVAFGPTKAVPVPVGARRIDGSGKFLMPGLADMHAHILGDSAAVERELYLYAANGVTTIRNMGFSDKEMILPWRARAAKGELVSPKIYAAAGPRSQGWNDNNSVEFVEQAKAMGYDLVKLYGTDGPALDSIVTTARRVGIPIAGHAPSYDKSSLALERAIAAGYTSIEHLTGFEHYLSNRSGNWWWWEFWEDTTFSPQEARQMLADSAKLRTMAVALQRAGVWNCPTLAMFDAGLVEAAAWPELRFLSAAGLEDVQEWQRTHPSPATQASAQAALDVRRAIIRALRDAGAGLLLGTDSPVPYMLPGFGVHRELEAFVRAGLSPYDALATGTRNVAAYFGTLASTGTVAVGKRADLVLLTGNPLIDIRYTMTPAGVMLGGRWLGRTELDRGLAAFEGQLTGPFGS